MKKKLFLTILVTLTTLLFAACGSKESETIFGTWVQHGADNTYTFCEDGTGTHSKGIQNNEINYKVYEDTIIIHDKDLWVFDTTNEFTFELKDGVLKFTDGVDTMVFSRQYEE